MRHEDGYCDDCGAEVDAAWISLDGSERCRDCAVGAFEHGVKATSAKRPEARDDGR